MPGIISNARVMARDIRRQAGRESWMPDDPTAQLLDALADELESVQLALKAMFPEKLGSEYEYLTNALYHACVEIARRALDATDSACERCDGDGYVDIVNDWGGVIGLAPCPDCSPNDPLESLPEDYR